MFVNLQAHPQRLSDSTRPGSEEVHDTVIFKERRVRSPFLNKTPLNIRTTDDPFWTLTTKEPSEERIRATTIIGIEIGANSLWCLGGRGPCQPSSLGQLLFLLILLYYCVKTHQRVFRKSSAQHFDQPFIVLFIELSL